MKKSIFIFFSIFVLLLFLGCTSSPSQTNTGSSQNSLVNSNNSSSNWSAKVAALGEPIYEKVTISSGYEILPFPGLTYNGLRDNWQAFYATNKDYTFAIYASPSIIKNAGTYDEVKQKVMKEYSAYSSSLKCDDISTSGWLTSTKAFSCTYVYSDYISYKIVTFYRDSSYIQTNLSVWGTSLQEYTYLFDEFNQKAVSWK